MAVDCGCHFLSGEKCHDFLLRGNKLSGLCLLQRLANKMGKHFNLCTREQLLNPEDKKTQLTFEVSTVIIRIVTD